ncbi:MAG: PAS domain S-box protein [Burkholderiaceae bacterium]
MRRQGYFFRQLVGLIALVAVPLLALMAYNLAHEARQARQSAYQAVENLATGIGHDTDSLLVATEQYLVFLAARPLVKALDDQRCDPLLEGVVQRRQHFANVFVTDLVGKPVCFSVKGPGPVPANVSGFAWFQQAANSDAMVLSKPFVAPVVQRTVAAMSLPLRDDARRRIGTVTVLLDLESVQRTWDRNVLPPGSRLTLFDQDGTILVTKPDFATLVGQDASAVIATALRANPQGVGVAPGIDGVERVFALKPMAAGRWQAAAAIPAAHVFADYRAQLQRNLVAGSAVVLAVLGLAFLMARRMSAPLSAIAKTARDVARGDRGARAEEAVPGEFHHVAREFNAMLDAHQQSEAELRESERRYADLFANVDMISLMLDAKGCVTYCNDYLLKLTGWSREEMIGCDWFRTLSPPERADIPAMFEDAMQGRRTPRHTETEIVTRSGARRMVRWHNSLLRSASGAIVGTASLGEDVTDVLQASLREQRQSDFYAALSRTNGAIVRMSDPATLYPEICRICVEHGHASIAYISLVDEGLVKPVAWAGPAEAFVSGFRATLDPAVPEGRGPTAQAVRTGRRQVSNHYEDDPSTLPWRDRAAAIGTKAAAAFPFRRGGVVVGTLSLHMTVSGFFDERLIDLVEEMTSDISFALDNFERELARAAAVQQAEADYARFHMLFQTAPVSMSIASVADQRLLDVNETYGAFTGQRVPELIGRHAFEPGLWPGEEERKAFVKQLRADGRVRNFEMRGTDVSGRQRDYLLQADLIEFDGQPCVLTIANDITDLRETQRQLGAQEMQLAGLVETAMDAIISIDAGHKVRLFNQAAAELFQIAPAEAIGRNIEHFIPARLHTAHREHVEGFARTGNMARRAGGLHTLVGLRADGSEFPIEASISKLGEGDAVLMTVVIRDASEMMRAAQARLAQAVAESASRAKTDFLSRMSHELRTPLNAVLGFSQLLQGDRTDPLSQKQHGQVEHIRTAGWHLLALINDVLDVSKIEAGHVDVEKRSVDLLELLEEVLRLNDGPALQQGITIEPLYRGGDRARVWADPIRLRQVMINLLSNAIKYNRRDGSVRVEVLRDAEFTHIEVSDSGLGMTAEQLQHLYEPFNRLGRERDGIEGTGLGLALTRQLVLLMHGNIDVRSEVGAGTTIRVSLLTHAAAPPLNPFAPPPIPQALASDDVAPSGVVLYIEDNPVNLLLVEHLLMRWPQVRLTQAETGAAGIAMAGAVQPDLVLLDMRLPDMDGLEVLAALRSDELTSGCRVVALSASAMPDEVTAARKAGAFDYWTKPLDFEHFLGEMKRLLTAPQGPA